MKNKNIVLLIMSILLIPTMVFASNGDNDFPVVVALAMEAFVSIHMSLFVLKPLAEMFSKENSKKTFWILFATRVWILLLCDFFVSPGIAIIDFFGLFVGVLIIVPICSAITKTPVFGASNQAIRTNTNAETTQPTNQVNGIELKCAKCGAALQITDKFCTSCGEPFDGNNVVVTENANAAIQTPPKVAMLPSNFDSMYSLSEDKMLEEFINRELTKAGVDKTSKLIPSDILKRKKILNIIFSILIFVYITLIFFHFPIDTYIIGIVILFIYFKVTRKYDLIKYLKKQLKARPGEKVSNIVMNVKNTFITDNSKSVIIIGILVAVVLPLIIFSSPRILYEKVEGGYAVRYYIFGLTNFKTATIPETHKNKKVVSLRGNTFSNMPFLKSVSLPDTVTEIRGQAFKNCYKLTEVNIPKKLKYLGGGAFYNAKSIKKVELPDTLTYLGGESFYGAKSLEYVKLSNSLTEIRGDSFEYCTSLKSITIPDNVTRIGGHAFYGDTSLSEVSISENSKLMEIGSSAFRQCSSLYNITIPSKTSVNERAFKESPTTVNKFGYKIYDIDSSVIDDSNKSVEDYWLDDYKKLANKSKHTSENYYVFKSGETVVFDKYEIIISVLRISQNGEMNYAVNTRTKKFGAGVYDSNNVGKSGNSYFYWNNCKISIIDTGSLDELKIEIQSVDELAESFKNAVQIKLTQNEKYMINNNTIELTYTSHSTIAEHEEFYMLLDGVEKCNMLKCNQFILSNLHGFEEINDDFMVKYVSAAWDYLVLIVYYN